MAFNPAVVGTLVNLTLGGLAPRHQSEVLHCRVRYFDPGARRPGLPPDVAALVEAITAEAVILTLVNLDPSDERTVIVQAGGYGEHSFTGVTVDGREITLDGPILNVHLGPGAGCRLALTMKRYANPPTVRQPWDQR
jgi:hypothetical protein